LAAWPYAEGALAGAPDAQAAKELHRENEALHHELSALQRTVDVEQVRGGPIFTSEAHMSTQCPPVTLANLPNVHL
jgi:hypothetical protein